MLRTTVTENVMLYCDTGIADVREFTHPKLALLMGPSPSKGVKLLSCDTANWDRELAPHALYVPPASCTLF